MVPGAPGGREGGPVAELTTALLEATREVVGADLAGLYVVGSTAQQDRTEDSDLDLLAVVHRSPAATRLGVLADRIVGLAERSAVPRTEYVAYDRRVVARPRHPLRYLLNVNAGPGIQRLVATGGGPAHWFLLDVAMARQQAVCLHGPPAGQLLGEPDSSEVAQAILDALRWHQRAAPRGVDTVLNACRSWHYLAGLGWTSKTAAATWAAQRWPGEVISAAVAGRRREPGVVALRHREVSDLLHHVRVLAESQAAAP